MVFQRGLNNQAAILVTGTAPLTTSNVEARFVPLTTGQGSQTAWTSLGLISGSSAFRGQVTVAAGWYRLDVRAKSGSTVLTQTQVNRVGVGEVFVVAGQSNVFGGFERVPNASEDRVSCVDLQQDSLSEQTLPLRFSHISYGTNIGPSQPPHIWGILGDRLVQRLNVPVLFLGAALGGSSSSQWNLSATGTIGTTPNSSVYRRLGATLLHYILRTGARAVLWHQGESDRGTPTTTYFNNIKNVIEKSRQQLGGNSLPWMMSRASYIDGLSDSNVIAAQNQLISAVPNVFPGPESDNITGTDNRPDYTHFKGAGLYRFTDQWDQNLSTSFFQNAAPFLPNDPAALITSGYTLPLTRRQGETIAVASVRSDAHDSDNQYVAQIVRVSDGATVYESGPSTDNPILVTIPTDLANGQYRLRTRSTHPVLLGTLGEPFNVQQSATPSPAFAIFRLPTASGGTGDPVIQKWGYRYEAGTYGFYATVQASAPVEVRIERIDGGSFSDSGWNLVPPSNQSPDYNSFGDFNYIRNYPPITAGLGGVSPGLYRYSIRRQGDTGAGLWYELRFLDGRNIIYYPMEPIAPITPPDLTSISYALPSTQYGITNSSLVVNILEINSRATSGQITVYVSKDPLVNISFNPTATDIGGRSVQNNAWTFNNSDPSYYVLTTNQVIQAGSKLAFGLTALLTPGQTRGTLTFSQIIVGGSGDEEQINNNSSSVRIDYFNK
ncbi:sialate O-acetylesterase [Spirosoma jeollabukense]